MTTRHITTILDTPTPERYTCAVYPCDKPAFLVEVSATGALYGRCLAHVVDTAEFDRVAAEALAELARWETEGGAVR